MMVMMMMMMMMMFPQLLLVQMFCHVPLHELNRRKILTFISGVLTIYMEKPEIPVGKSNGSHHSVWNVLQIMGFRLW